MSIRLRSKIPASIRLFFMRYLFGLSEDHDQRLGRVVSHNRMILSARYIDGEGIEIGGLGRPLDVVSTANVSYVDRFSVEELKANYPEMPAGRVLAPDIVANGETLDPISDASQKFVIANHVVEHFQNPLLFFHNVYRVLKEDGILFLAIPNKEETFDHERPVTDFAHLERDFSEGPEWSKRQHFEEFVEFADLEDIGRPGWQTEVERETLISKLINNDYSIHFHVWDTNAMIEMITGMAKKYHLNFHIRHVMSSGDEGVFILQKGQQK